jgi:ribosomal-protein-alanine N-acetyltransferase
VQSGLPRPAPAQLAFAGALELEGQRCLLRGVRSEDAPRAFAILRGNRLILDWLEWPGPADPAEMRERFGQWRVRRPAEEGDDWAFAIVDLEDAAFAGALTLRFGGHALVGVVGYWLDPLRWGRGLASDALRLAAWLAFERLGSQSLCARVHQGNERSRRLLLRAGWSEVGAGEVPDQPACGARPQWGFRLERDARERSYAPMRARIELEPAALSACEPPPIRR